MADARDIARNTVRYLNPRAADGSAEVNLVRGRNAVVSASVPFFDRKNPSVNVDAKISKNVRLTGSADRRGNYNVGVTYRKEF